ncbi:DUF397 domain-containing protein [Amycolatopsis sp. NPDC059021]|uniref:DUF397 domain-containing protein n=1 Tax=Amycolatopsis sp. NPDC059021 TaxID=3346704 RepID=UPI003670A611
MSPNELAGPHWFKSSYSADSANCVEVAFLGWSKSSYSNNTANCVEVAFGEAVVGVRDSKAPALPALTVPAAAWSALVCELND